MSTSTTLTKEEILHLAHLVRLELSDSEIQDLQSQLGDTIDYIQNINELETEGVKSAARSVSMKNVSFEDGTSNPRTLTQQDAVKNSLNSKNGYFVVPKILDK